MLNRLEIGSVVLVFDPSQRRLTFTWPGGGARVLAYTRNDARKAFDYARTRLSEVGGKPSGDERALVEVAQVVVRALRQHLSRSRANTGENKPWDG